MPATARRCRRHLHRRRWAGQPRAACSPSPGRRSPPTPAPPWRPPGRACRPACGRPTNSSAAEYAGCAATIGAMPRCDFACTGCYLGEGANRVPPLPLAAVSAQLDRLRDWLGSGGNLQLSDGEITLRPAEGADRADPLRARHRPGADGVQPRRQLPPPARPAAAPDARRRPARAQPAHRPDDARPARRPRRRRR